jgi:5'-3' exonuclease
LSDNILIIDAHNAIYRACIKFGATLNQEVDDSILFTFNFFRNLRPIIEQLSPDKVFIALEGHPKHRYDLYPGYKANRIIKVAAKQETRDTFFKTKDIILPLLDHLPFTLVRAELYEADDTIFTLCENMKDEDLIVLSSDSDFIQLLQKGYRSIRVYNPIKKCDMEAPAFLYKAWKALAGDKSDSIPALLKPKKALAAASDPEVLKEFVKSEENRANLSINRQLIEFALVPEEDLIIKEGIKNFDFLKEAFINMKFDSITNDASWKKYVSTFDCIKF